MATEAAPKRLSKQAATAKIQHWCAYQERSHDEVKNKLYAWNLYPDEVDQIVSDLIAENFLNEERFAMAYVSGKFKIKKWGKIKIRQGLKQKRVTDKLITKALNTIDGDAYLKTIAELAEKKQRISGKVITVKDKLKLVNYLLTRGFERDLIFDVLKANNL